MFNFNLAALIVIFIGMLSAGCEAENGSAFTGRWVEKTEASAKHPRILEISLADGVYILNEDIYLNGKYQTQREVGQPMSKSVISVKNGMRNIRLENGVVYYRNSEYARAE